MRIVDKQQIVAHIDLDLAVQWIEEGFVAFSNGTVQVPPVQSFAFTGANGDCCVKSAFMEGSETFTVKISTGFYDNPGKGLASNDGLMLVLSASNGQPIALLQDEGWLTCMRTALAGRIAARLLAPREVHAIGILGTGMQARMQLEQLLPVTACRRVIVWGRSEVALASYKAFASALGFEVHTTVDPREVAQGANLIVCATPSRQALIDNKWVRPGTHITAVGADAPGKQELDPLLVARADRIIVDSIVQCRQYGEVSHALKAGLIEEGRLSEIGALLDGRISGRANDDEITLVDLTGVAIQDAQIARCALQSLP
ncbi:ornithine cyclodeaminase family protein [Phytopseudomonas punonensis]|uniref:Ornithine cyclodeaminase n=1 Tax=Phytopseudomonas punonensis TaxID=1220495 RepID=A0A1M7G520_9GAMM|nr:ornithine cyclodeaminase family protein [Pseudomonas punonensis]SHM11464.1 ornithine cyclodeaminase [Pseudomonas punonensis]